ncbi:MAG TPA: tripartite tricarboxylate transporter permease [Kribbella sp.]|uniref:tripartite tricarboxylate transporter permease n=1 Tax=Kribbella sp. TaxID=1871183 RepID=UPI002D776ABE|nr:tripartite tricarboxylate transporter permease [Kribbella sp.]HET6296709.1 tripartite tricarboxylate transporter permease [Kribbella sp.]
MISLAVFNDLLHGFSTVLDPMNLLWAVLGVTLGMLVGILPGIGPALTIALLLPITFNFSDPIGAFIMFAGIYYGAMYGGSTTSILINTPGESASVATAIEGHKMALKGRARAALATAAIGSFVAGTISTVLLTFVAKPIGNLASEFQSTDYFAITLLAMVAVTALVGHSLVRGLLSLTVGLFIGLIGLDSLSGAQRYTFGTLRLLDGVDVVIVIVGLFAIGETLHVASKLRSTPDRPAVLEKGQLRTGYLNKSDWSRSWAPWLRGTALGFPFGAIPSGGAEVPTFLSYTIEKRRARKAGRKHPDEFGDGAIEGVAGPEAANNASFSGVLVPLLTLGLPTSATAAVMLAAFQIFNVQPGPQLFEDQGTLVWTLIASLYVGNLILLIMNLPLIQIWVQVLKVPRPLLYAGILVFACLGVYSLSGSGYEVLMALLIGVVGFFMRKLDFPIAPVILGVILGPTMEEQFRRSLVISNGDASVFFTRPLSLIIIVLTVLALFVPYLPRIVARIRGTQASRDRLTFGEDD